MNIYALYLIIFSCGLTTGIIVMSAMLMKYKNIIKSYKRELEKESISQDESSSKVKVLESKIEVLETALKKALNK